MLITYFIVEGEEKKEVFGEFYWYRVEDESYPSSIRGFLQWLKNNDLASVHNHVDIQP